MATTNPLGIVPKDPDAILDYSIDWSTWLGDDTLSSSTWIVPAGINQTASLTAGALNTIWLAGGTAGASYLITNRITTVGGRTEDRTFQLNVADR